MYQITWLETIISLINIHILLTSIMQGKLRIKIILIFSFTVIIPCLFLSFILKNTSINQVVIMFCGLLSILLPIFTVKNLKKIQIIYVCLFYIGVSLTLVTSCLWIASTLKMQFIIILIVDVTVYCILLVVCILIRKRIIFSKLFQHIMLIPKNLKILILCITWFSAILSYWLSSLFYEIPYSTFLVTIECLTALLIILLGIMCPLLIANNISGAYYKTILSNVEKQLKEQIKHYEHITKANSEIRNFRHDFKNLKIGLSSLLVNRDTDGALKLLHECDKPFNSEYILFETGDPVADALLSEKQEEALKNDIEIKFNGVIPNNHIAPADICVILGNALDNALEACVKIHNNEIKIISVSAQYNNGFLFLTIENPVLNSVLINGNSIPTTKDDKQSHGFGLYSIQSVIRNYSGSMKLSCENNLFMMKINLDLNQIK